MKKLMAGLLAGAMVLSMAACGSSSSQTASSSAAADTTAAASDTIKGVEDLPGKKIGVQEGTTGDIYVAGEFGEDSVVRYKNGYEAVQALLTDKIDCVIIDDQVAKSLAAANEGLTVLEEAYTDEDYALYINPDQTELLDKVNDAIAEIQSNGVMDGIIKYYIDGDETAAAYHEQTLTEFPNGTLQIAVNPYFPPYEYYEGEEIWGVDADMCRAIGDILGMQVEFEPMEFAASLAAVQTGKYPMAMGGITVTEERSKSGLFTTTYYTGRQSIIVKE